MFEPGAFSPFEIREAARGLCELVWVTSWGDPIDGPVVRLLPRLGTVIDVRGLDRRATVAAVRQARPDGIVVFTDAAQQPAAALAQELGLPFHTPATALTLRDKLEQRGALRAGGLPVPAAVGVSGSHPATPAELDLSEITWPAVLKPRRGSGGGDTFLVTDPRHLARVLAEMPSEREFILEQYLPDRPGSAGLPVADMVSVELVVIDRVPQHVAVSGRFPIIAPLRENGGFLPSQIEPEESDEVVEAAKRAAAALGVQRGVLHIEVKQTPDGPRIVEVNGRVGGIVPMLLARVGGPPLIEWALRLALGLDVGPVEPVMSGSGVAFYYAWLPPVGDYRLRQTRGFDAVFALPQIDRVWLNRQAGDIVRSRDGGMFGHLAAAYGAVADHDELWPLVGELASALSFDLVPTSSLAAG